MRNDREAISVKAQQLLDDELLGGAFAEIEAEVVGLMKSQNLNGTPEATDYALELIRKLQVVEGVKQTLRKKITNQNVLDYNAKHRANMP